MRVEWTRPQNSRGGLLAEGEIHFDDHGPLKGMKLVGFAVRRSKGETYVTFPGRAFGSGDERYYYDFLRSSDAENASERKEAAAIVKEWLLAEYKGWIALHRMDEAIDKGSLDRTAVAARTYLSEQEKIACLKRRA